MIADFTDEILLNDIIQFYYKEKKIQEYVVTSRETLPYEYMIGNIIDTEKVKNLLNSRTLDRFDVLLFSVSSYKIVLIAVQQPCDTIICENKLNIVFENINQINFPKLLYITYNCENKQIQILHENYTLVHQDLFLPFSGIINENSLIFTSTFKQMLEKYSYKLGQYYYSNTNNNLYLGSNVELNYDLIYEYMNNGLDVYKTNAINIPFSMK